MACQLLSPTSNFFFLQLIKSFKCLPRKNPKNWGMVLNKSVEDDEKRHLLFLHWRWWKTISSLHLTTARLKEDKVWGTFKLKVMSKENFLICVEGGDKRIFAPFL